MPKQRGNLHHNVLPLMPSLACFHGDTAVSMNLRATKCTDAFFVRVSTHVHTSHSTSPCGHLLSSHLISSHHTYLRLLHLLLDLLLLSQNIWQLDSKIRQRRTPSSQTQGTARFERQNLLITACCFAQWSFVLHRGVQQQWWKMRVRCTTWMWWPRCQLVNESACALE